MATPTLRRRPGRRPEPGREANISPLIAQLLLNRGVDDASGVEEVLRRPPLRPARPRDLARRGRGRRPDRRRDPGPQARSSSTAITTWTASAAPASSGPASSWPARRHVDYYIPHRVEEGYGVNADALRKLATEHRADLIITVDCGISAIKEARLARELGVELIITDHHTIGPELPEADVVVHPELPGSTVPVRRALRVRRGVQAGLAGLQEVRRRQEGLAAPPRLPGQVDRPGGDGDRRRRDADPRREPAPRPPRAGQPGRLAEPGPSGA